MTTPAETFPQSTCRQLMDEATPDQIAIALTLVLVPASDARTSMLDVFKATQRTLATLYGCSAPLGGVKRVLRSVGVRVAHRTNAARYQFAYGVRLAEATACDTP